MNNTEALRELSTPELIQELIDRLEQESHILRCIDDGMTDNARAGFKRLGMAYELRTFLRTYGDV